MRLRDEAAETRAALAAAWAALPDTLRLPTQFLGRQYVGCAATIGTMPRCDFACSGCYLGRDANRARPASVAELESQMRLVRTWLGPGGNLQVTDGEVTLRAEADLIRLIAYARSIGLGPMLMTHGETFRRKPGLLERLMISGGLTEVSFHVDTTMHGRRDGYAHARSEVELDGLRAGRRPDPGGSPPHRPETRSRLDGNGDAAKSRRSSRHRPMVSSQRGRVQDGELQPVAAVGRTAPTLQGVDADDLWQRIAEGRQ